MSEPNTGNIAQRVRGLAQPFADALGLCIWDVRYLKEGIHWYLRLWVDKPGGVGLEDCEALSRAIDAPLDEADFIKEFYFLEICSPGIERELTREEHFAQYIGSRVCLRPKRPINGQRELNGTLLGCVGGIVRVAMESGDEIALQKKECASVRLAESPSAFDDETE
ncbi:MAG: ribosome maturation factor RimP [Oscillospiraceae bacterium]|jgi:ribosome maturation factor RimP|nr:ribosome maturation factor RimP [Oscillospiraceae bacterium]